MLTVLLIVLLILALGGGWYGRGWGGPDFTFGLADGLIGLVVLVSVVVSLLRVAGGLR
jgi:hypothetical protein